jgi:hypothetical protein
MTTLVSARAPLPALLALPALLLAAGNANAQAKSVKDWKALGAGAEVKPGTAYTLHNLTAKSSLRYGGRDWGINLVWDKSTSLNNIKFQRQGGAGPLKYGDLVAVHVAKGSYVKYEKRNFGIRLAWSKAPVHEWVILGGAKGTPVKTGAALSLYNRVEKDFLIYAKRPVGINLRWWKDRGKPGTVAEAAVDLALKKGVEDIAKDLVRQGFKELAKEFGKK